MVGHAVQVAGEQIGVRRVAQHLLVLEPLRVGVPPQVEQPQVRRPLLEVLRRDLHQPVGHLRRMVGVGAGQPGEQVRPVTLQPGREDDLIMRRLALEQRRQIGNSHCRQAIRAAVGLSAVCRGTPRKSRRPSQVISRAAVSRSDRDRSQMLRATALRPELDALAELLQERRRGAASLSTAAPTLPSLPLAARWQTVSQACPIA